MSNTIRIRALIKAARDANGWSYGEIARRSKILSRSTIHAIATNEQRADLLSKEHMEALALGIGVPFQTVLDAALQDAGLIVIRDDQLPPEAVILTEAMEGMTPEQRQALIATALELSRMFRHQ